MRVLTSRHRRVGGLANSTDGSFLFGSGDTDTALGMSAVFGIDQWEPLHSEQASAIAVGRMCVCRILPLADGSLVAGGVTDEGQSTPFAFVRPLSGQAIPLPLTAGMGFGAARSSDGERFVVAGRLLNGTTVVQGYRSVTGGAPTTEWSREPFPMERFGWRWLHALDFLPDSDRFLSVESHSEKRFVRTLSASDGRLLSTTSIPVPSGTSEVRHASGGTRFVVRSTSTLLSYDLTNPKAKPVKVASGNRKHFTGIAVHPDGRRVLATCNDETVREYDAVTLQELRAYAWKVGKLRCVAIAPDGATAAAGSDTGKVVVWDLE